MPPLHGSGACTCLLVTLLAVDQAAERVDRMPCRDVYLCPEMPLAVQSRRHHQCETDNDVSQTPTWRVRHLTTLVCCWHGKRCSMRHHASRQDLKSSIVVQECSQHEDYRDEGLSTSTILHFGGSFEESEGPWHGQNVLSASRGRNMMPGPVRHPVPGRHAAVQLYSAWNRVSGFVSGGKLPLPTCCPHGTRQSHALVI